MKITRVSLLKNIFHVTLAITKLCREDSMVFLPTITDITFYNCCFQLKKLCWKITKDVTHAFEIQH